MSLAKLLIAGVALAASTSALACDCSVGARYGARGGWAGQGSNYQGSGYQGSSYQSSGYQGGGYVDQDQGYGQQGYGQQGYAGGGYRSSSSSVNYGSSYERSGGYSEQSYDVSGAWLRAHRGEAHQDRGYGGSDYERSGYEHSGRYESSGHYGYSDLSEEGNARAYRGAYSYGEHHGGGWSYSEESAHFGPPPCRHLADRGPGGWRPLPVCPGEGEVSVDNGFFLGDAGGVGGFPDYEGGGGGGGGYVYAGGSAGAGAHAFASASARASASVSIRFRGGFHGHGGGHHGGGHHGGGCGCGK